jgi:hypothetical protein
MRKKEILLAGGSYIGRREEGSGRIKPLFSKLTSRMVVIMYDPRQKT